MSCLITACFALNLARTFSAVCLVRPQPSDRFSSAQHTRHIDRKLFKLREMRGAGLVTVKYLGTEENTADIFTKILDRQPFEKHRKTVLNTAANDGVPSARDKKAMGAWPRRF